MLRRSSGLGVVIAASIRLDAGSAPFTWTPADWGADRLVDYTADDVLTSGSAVTAFVDQLGVNNATQGNAALQGELTTDASLGGASVVYFTNDVYTYAVSSYTGTSFSIYFVFNSLDSDSAAQFAYDTQTGRFLLRRSSADISFYDGSYKSLGNAWVTGGASRLFTFNGSTSVASSYGPGGVIGSDNTYSSKTIKGTQGLLGYYGGTGGNTITACNLARFVIVKRDSTTADRTNWFAWSLSEYGV